MGIFDQSKRYRPTPEQETRLAQLRNPRQRKAILAAIRAGKTIPESVWSPLPESIDVAGLIDRENAQAGTSQGWGAAPAAPRIGRMQEGANGKIMAESTFQLWRTPEETSLEKIGGQGLTTLFAGGIVNPFGPTLTAVATDGVFQPGRTLPIVYLTNQSIK